MMAFAPVQSDVHALVRKLGLSPDLAMLERAWEAEAGGLAAYARIAAVDQASLVLDVVSHAAMQEIALRKRELVRRINKHLCEPLIRQIVTRVSAHG